jgi:hypothetical protein
MGLKGFEVFVAHGCIYPLPFVFDMKNLMYVLVVSKAFVYSGEQFRSGWLRPPVSSLELGEHFSRFIIDSRLLSLVFSHA